MKTKRSKRLLSVALSLVLTLALSATAFAEPPSPPPGGGGPGEGGPGGGPGGSTPTWTGATTITSAATESGKTYTSTTADENALLIDTADAVTLTEPTVTKSGDSDGGDSTSFYGTNAAVMVKGGGTTTITGGTITTSATGANAVFSYGGNGAQNGASGDGTTVRISDTTIHTTGNGSGGIMTTGGGVTIAENLTVTTEGGSSAPIRTDRGGGTVTVTDGSYTSSGLGSPAIYSTADVTVSGATLESKLSEGVCIEGKNSVTLSNVTLTANNTKTNGNATFLDSIMIYQSMSGDADSGTSTFSMSGGTLNSKSGHVFHVTNTNAVINLSGVTIHNTDAANVLLSVCDDGWRGASNVATLNADAQTLSGDILVGSDSTLTLKLTNGSSYTGAISGSITNAKGSTVSTSVGTVNVTLDATSKWTLTADTYVTSFSGSAANVIANGHTLYVGGTALSGTSGSAGEDTGNDASAADEPAAWAKAEVSAAIEAGLVPANLQKNYQSSVSRAEVAQMFIDLLEKASGQSIDELLGAKGVSVNANAFTDTTDAAVLAANALGLIKGTGNGRFSPNDTLTRAQIAALLNRAAGVLGVDTAGYTHSFTDVSGHWVDSELGWPSSVGVITGRGNGIFDPNTALTTQEAIAITYRAYQVLHK